jgi:phosphate transport system protein
MTHTYSQFDTELQRLRSATVAMAQLAQRQVERAVDAVVTDDAGLIAQVLADEAEVNRMHLQTDLLCNRMIAKMQPIAADLREILAALHMNNDLERVGDEAKKIAKKARDLGPRPLPIGTARIEQMAGLACEMLRLAMDAYRRQDAPAARALIGRDDAVDALRDELIGELVSVMTTKPESVSQGLALIFVVQSLERVGDHATNLAESVLLAVEGSREKPPKVKGKV